MLATKSWSGKGTLSSLPRCFLVVGNVLLSSACSEEADCAVDYSYYDYDYDVWYRKVAVACELLEMQVCIGTKDVLTCERESESTVDEAKEDDERSKI